MDVENKIYLGQPIVEAARLEHLQKWLGISLGISCSRIYPTEAHCLTLYTNQYKNELLEHKMTETFEINGLKQEGIIGYGNIASTFALNWPRQWFKDEKTDPLETIREMDKNPEFSMYYQNTAAFIQFAKDNPNIMKPLEDVAPPIVPLMVRYIDDKG